MWRQTHGVGLLLSVIVTGSRSASWNMAVSPVVFVPRGRDAVLGCSFSHPAQHHYSGTIAVKWLAREAAAPPFLVCSVKNDSAGGLGGGCSAAGLKHSLQGDPRRGQLSLLIRTVHLADNGSYFCRVELQGWRNNDQKETQLYVTVEPQISSLSVVESSSGLDDAPRWLQCEATGHPLPTVSWLSASGTPPAERVRTSVTGPYRLVSSVPYLEGEVLTCRAESRLGGAEQTYPASNSLMMALEVGGVILVLLLSAGLVFYMRNRARGASPPVHEDASPARADTCPIYGNADVVEHHALQRSDRPAGGDVELQLVYSAVSLTRATSSQHAGPRSQKEADVLYSPVNVQQ